MSENLNIQALQDEALRLWAVDQQSALELGKALVAVREGMAADHGAFTRWYRANDLDENRVYYCIRKAEGKIKDAPKPQSELILNKYNLAVAKFAPRESTKYVSGGIVHLGPDGITATDGYYVARVSLPSQKEPVTTETLLPIAVLDPNGYMGDRTGCGLGLSSSHVRSLAGQVEKSCALPKQEFPPYQKIFDKAAAAQPSSATLQVKPQLFQKLCEFMESMEVEGAMQLKITDRFVYAFGETPKGQRAEIAIQHCGPPQPVEKAA